VTLGSSDAILAVRLSRLVWFDRVGSAGLSSLSYIVSAAFVGDAGVAKYCF